MISRLSLLKVAKAELWHLNRKLCGYYKEMPIKESKLSLETSFTQRGTQKHLMMLAVSIMFKPESTHQPEQMKTTFPHSNFDMGISHFPHSLNLFCWLKFLFFLNILSVLCLSLFLWNVKVAENRTISGLGRGLNIVLCGDSVPLLVPFFSLGLEMLAILQVLK